MGDEHPEGFDLVLAGSGLVAALLGIFIGWFVWGKDRATQEESDRFAVPVSIRCCGTGTT